MCHVLRVIFSLEGRRNRSDLKLWIFNILDCLGPKTQRVWCSPTTNENAACRICPAANQNARDTWRGILNNGDKTASMCTPESLVDVIDVFVSFFSLLNIVHKLSPLRLPGRPCLFTHVWSRHETRLFLTPTLSTSIINANKFFTYSYTFIVYFDTNTQYRTYWIHDLVKPWTWTYVSHFTKKL